MQRKTLKRALSVILVAVLVFCSVPAVHARDYTNATVESVTPVVYLAGDSQEISYDNNQKTFRVENIFDVFQSDDDSNVKEAVINILAPFIREGILTNKWDNYYAAVEKEIGELFEPVRLDCNGNVPEWSDSGLKPCDADDNMRAMRENRKSAAGTYDERAYRYYYDWRLDPVELAEGLNDYIKGVKAVTGSDKVCLDVRCLGCNVAFAYLAKYGAGDLKGFGVDVGVSLGCEFVTGALTGEFGVDGNAFNRLFKDLEVFADFSVDRFITDTIALIDDSGLLDSMTAVARKTVYEKIEYGIISVLATSSLMTYPNYWALVSYDKFDTALRYVFGEEGSEKRQEYAGLIEKITRYNENIKKNIIPIFQSVADCGVNVCVISKYGTQMIPLLKDSDIIGDQYISAAGSSFGATTADSVYETLSDEYIAEREAEGLGRYISPDKQIDASTCLFPDSTWFFKGVSHGYYITPECNILVQVMDADRQLTVDDFEWTQFAAYRYTENICEPMNEENCRCENWTADASVDKPSNIGERTLSVIKAFRAWIKSLRELIIRLFGEKIKAADAA